MERYIGLDDHAMSSSFAVINEQGKKLQSTVVETNGEALVGFIKTIPGRIHLCLEEGSRSSWLYEILSSYVDEIVVTQVQKSRGDKDDIRDAFQRAEQLRIGAVKPIFKERGQFSQLRSMSDVYLKVRGDKVRVQNRIKALFRSRGVCAADNSVYLKSQREQWIKQLPSAYVASVQVLYAQYDAATEAKKQAKKHLVEQSHRHRISAVLETCPGFGEIRAALMMAVVVSPHRFRTKRQFWSYCGLAVVMRSSSDWERTPSGWQRVVKPRTRGLNRNFNHTMKDVFKGAASGVIMNRQEPLYSDYQRMLDQGVKPPLAKLTLARKIASTALVMWKNQEVYDPDKYRNKE
jgi:transposase